MCCPSGDDPRRNPYIEFDSLVGVGLAEKLSILEIFDLLGFWPYDPLLRG
jgi:hypothetical protein